MPSTTHNLYKQLHAEWVFLRTIEDRTARQTLRAEGYASFQNAGMNQLCYTESGHFVDADRSDAQFFRSYLYKFSDSAIEIYFADGLSKGQLFHRLQPNLTETAVTDRHVCGFDLYDGRYDFTDDTYFSIQYNVKGGYKDYTMTTHYKKPVT